MSDAKPARFFVVTANDKPGSLELRERLRPAHRDWLREHPGHELTVVQAGPSLDAQGRMHGTILVVAAPGPEQVERFVEADPYSQGGLFARVEVREWHWTLGRPPGADTFVA